MRFELLTDLELTPEEQESRDRTTMDMAERRAADRKSAKYRRQARIDFEMQAKIAAEKDAAYRQTKARRYVELRAEGETSEGSRIRAEGDSAELRSERDIASSLAKAALLRVDEAERNSVSIRDIHKTSERIDGVAA
jgi:hypothetical protein